MRKPSLLIIFLTVFIDLIGFGIVMPLLPLYSKQFGASGLMVGMIMASFSLMQFLFAPVWGKWSDKIGRRPILLVSNAGSALSYALFAIASSMAGDKGLLLLLCSRIFAGICGANLSVASAYIADISPPEKRSKSMGLIGMSFGLGFILGPALGAGAAHFFGRSGPGWVAATICAANFLLGCFILVESRSPTAEPTPPRTKMGQWRHTFSQPTVGFVVAVYFFATFCFSIFETTFGLILQKKFHYSDQRVLLLLSYCGLLAAIIQGGLIGKVVKALGERRLISLSLFVTGLSLLLLPYFSALSALLITVGLFAIGSGFHRPPIFGLISILTPAAEQGSTLGVTQSAGSLARIIAPVIGGLLFDLKPEMPYLMCAGICVAVGAISWGKLGDHRDVHN
ncbi:MAG: MFS transporter [Verrucomicrobiota bacterium]|nr:MFS transporter [Verrucomicrobiota bacterium]